MKARIQLVDVKSFYHVASRDETQVIFWERVSLDTEPSHLWFGSSRRPLPG